MKIIADKSTAFVIEAFSPLGEVAAIDGREITPDTIKDADILIVGTATRVDRRLLEGSKIRFVATATTGFDHIDIEYLKRRRIGFAHALAQMQIRLQNMS